MKFTLLETKKIQPLWQNSSILINIYNNNTAFNLNVSHNGYSYDKCQNCVNTRIGSLIP